jgi:hypothetical protein
MRADNVIRVEAMDALIAALGTVEAERFISMVKRDTFDYTEWQRDNLFKDMTIDEIHAAATKHEQQRI